MVYWALNPVGKWGAQSSFPFSNWAGSFRLNGSRGAGWGVHLSGSALLGCPCWCLWSENQTLTFKISCCCIHGWLTPNRILSDRKSSFECNACWERWTLGKQPKGLESGHFCFYVTWSQNWCSLDDLFFKFTPMVTLTSSNPGLVALSTFCLSEKDTRLLTALGLWHSRLHRCMVLEIEGTLVTDRLSIGFCKADCVFEWHMID